MATRVLVVDDDQQIRDTLRRQLRSIGYEADAAQNGRAALAMLKEAAYDAVVTDYQMPEMDGTVLLGLIREHLPSLPVVIMTGAIGGTVTSETFLEQGAHACLSKPFHRYELVQALKHALPPERVLAAGPP
jgi:CheY-like chemotaxis protein